MPTRRERTALIAILTIAALLRVAAIVATGPATLRFGDAQDYVDAATQVCREGRYPERGSLPFFRAPGLPLFLAAATFCHPASVVAAKLALVACDVATTGLVAALVLLLFGNDARRAALLAAALAAIDPFLIAAASDVTSEPLATALLTAALVALLRSRDDAHAVRLAALGGVAMGLAVLTRPGALAVAPVWLLLPLTGARRAAAAPAARRRVAVALAFVLATGATIAPWTVRNWLRFGELIVVNDAGGYNAWRGTHPLLHAALARSGDPASFAATSAALERDLAHAVQEDGPPAGASPRERERHWWAQALARLAADPARSTPILTRNAVAFVRPWLDPAAHGMRAVALSAAWFVPLLACAALGLAAVARRDRALAVLLVAGVLVAAAAHVPFQTVLRFRLPFSEPLLLALAATPLAFGWRKLRAPKRSARVDASPG